MSQADELSKALDRLESCTLLPLSMASRELFHSNLLEWLVNKHSAAGSVVARGLGLEPGDRVVRAEREVGVGQRRKIDLCLAAADEHGTAAELWVELKVGAHPAAEQVETYATLLAERAVDRDHERARRGRRAGADPVPTVRRHAYVSMIAPSWRRRGWKQLNLWQLARVVRLAAEEVPPGFERDLVRHEAALLRALHGLGKVWEVDRHLDDPWFLPDELVARVKHLRLQTIVGKSRIAALLRHLDEIGGEGRRSLGKVDMFHAVGVVDVQY